MNTTIKLIKLVTDNETGSQRPVNGYTFEGRAEFDKAAFARAYPWDDPNELERRIDDYIDGLYDGDSPIYETNIGLCTVFIDWETKEPLCWCKVKPAE
jgi:hypothetical protein